MERGGIEPVDDEDSFEAWQRTTDDDDGDLLLVTAERPIPDPIFARRTRKRRGSSAQSALALQTEGRVHRPLLRTPSIRFGADGRHAFTATRADVHVRTLRGHG